MILSDNFFKKVENKTNVNKETIVNLASKLQKNNLKDETTLREVIKQLSDMAGKSVSKEQEDKIISAIVNDKVPKDLDKYVDKNF
jgi:high-affinity Fe2+/Pb2+ permease